MYPKAFRILIILALCQLVTTTEVAAAQHFLGIFPKGDKPGGLLFSVLTVLALLLALVVHESGHLAAGLAKGFRFELFIVGPLGVRRTDKGIQLFLNKNVGYMGGVAVTVPVSYSKANRKKFAAVVAAGPLASVSFSLLAFLLCFASFSGAARGFWFVAGAASVAVFLATTLPKKTGPFFTDRAKFQRLISKGKTGEMEEALLTIMAHYITDNSCKNIPVEQARFLQQDPDPVMRFWGYYYVYGFYKDNHLQDECEEARKNLESVRHDIPAQLWKALNIDSAPAA